MTTLIDQLCPLCNGDGCSKCNDGWKRGRPRGRKNYDPAICIWAALRAQELITVRESSEYRLGRRRPTSALRRAWTRLGYDVDAMTWPEKG